MNEFFGLELLVSHGVQPRGVLHVGAHLGQEAEHYREFVGNNVVWIEAHPEVCESLRSVPEVSGQLVHQACLSNTTGDVVEFYVNANDVASSLFQPELISLLHPHAKTVETLELETITYPDLLASLNDDQRTIHERCNVLVLDIQGAELLVIEGMGEVLTIFDAIVTEYSTIEWYAGGAQLSQLDSFLRETFSRVVPVDEEVSLHADALYLRRTE